MKIKLGPASKRTSVHTYQTAFLAASIRRLEEVYTRQFREISELTYEDFVRLRGLQEYQAFMEAALVCGFVCDDFPTNFPVQDIHARPGLLSDMPFQKLRQYVHTIQRTEKWCSDYSPTLFNALRTGALSIVAERLESDMSLVESAAPGDEVIDG